MTALALFVAGLVGVLAALAVVERRRAQRAAEAAERTLSRLRSRRTACAATLDESARAAERLRAALDGREAGPRESPPANAPTP